MTKLAVENKAYMAWIKIDQGLPWIELTESFQTKIEAKASAKEKLSGAKIKIVKLPK
jgi:hypothetical protein